MLSILDLLRERGLEPRKVKADEWSSPCPGCGGTDRFHCWPDRSDGGNGWCRQCEWKGDTIQFCRDFLGMEFKEACEHVGRDDKATAPTPRRTQAPKAAQVYQPTRPGLPPALWQQKAAELVAWAHAHLLRNTEQLAYLAGRGIDLDAVRFFRLGWNPGEQGRDIYRSRESWGLAEELKPDGKTPKRLWIPRGIVVPVFAPHEGTDMPVRIRIRRPKEHRTESFPEPYIMLAGGTSQTMVTDREARAFVVVEAELDGMLVHAACARELPGKVAGLALGSLAFKPDAATDELLQRALSVLVALDYEPVSPEQDKAKAATLARVMTWWTTRYERAERWPVPQGKDPGDAYTLGVDIGAWVASGLPPVLRLKDAETMTDGPFASAGAVSGGARFEVPGRLARAAKLLAEHMSEHGIVLRRSSGGGALLPVRGEATTLAAMEDVIFLMPDDLAKWLAEQGADEVTAEVLGVARG